MSTVTEGAPAPIFVVIAGMPLLSGRDGFCAEGRHWPSAGARVEVVADSAGPGQITRAQYARLCKHPRMAVRAESVAPPAPASDEAEGLRKEIVALQQALAASGESKNLAAQRIVDLERELAEAKKANAGLRDRLAQAKQGRGAGAQQ